MDDIVTAQRDLNIMGVFKDGNIDKINKLLTPDFDVNLADKYGYGNILILCLKIAHENNEHGKDIIKRVLAYPNLNINFVSNVGNNVILYEFSYNHNVILTGDFDRPIQTKDEVLQLLISHPRADLDLHDANHNSILQYAILYCCDDIIIKYIIPKVKNINHYSPECVTTLDLAFNHNRNKIVRRLLLAGAKFYEEMPSLVLPNVNRISQEQMEMKLGQQKWLMRTQYSTYTIKCQWMAEFDLLKFEIAKVFACVVCICDDYFTVKKQVVSNNNIIKRLKTILFNEREKLCQDKKHNQVIRFFNISTKQAIKIVCSVVH